jgi:nucleoside-diphosphate-sugar epimerase
MINAIVDKLSGKKILITGGLGFVGSNMVVKLLEKGIKPIILDYIPEGTNIDKNYVPFSLEEVEYHNIDLSKRTEVVNEFSNFSPDFIVHLASMTTLTKDFDHAHQSIDINIKGTVNLLEGS